MNEKILREAVRTAIKEVVGDKATPSKDDGKVLPQDKEHLTNNKENLNKELLRRWGLTKKK